MDLPDDEATVATVIAKERRFILSLNSRFGQSAGDKWLDISTHHPTSLPEMNINSRHDSPLKYWPASVGAFIVQVINLEMRRYRTVKWGQFITGECQSAVYDLYRHYHHGPRFKVGRRCNTQRKSKCIHCSLCLFLIPKHTNFNQFYYWPGSII